MTRLATRPHLALAAWTALLAVAWLLHPPPSSWHFFHDAAGLPGGLQLWRAHPDYQFGPATVAVAAVLRLLAGSHDAWAARLLLTPIAPVLVWLLEDAALAVRPAIDPRRLRRAALLAGLVLVPIWDYIALGSLHLDDGVALTCAVLAAWALARRHPMAAAVALGLAANAKPWAAAFLPLALAVPAGDRRRTATVALGLAVLPWAPFFLGAPGTLRALQGFHIPTMSSSALHVLDAAARRTPGWDRPLQLVLGTAVAALAVRRGRWPGALLAAVSVRLLLDPGSHLYYTASLVVVALVWDLLGSPFVVPWATVVTATALQLPRVLGAPVAFSGWLRLLVTVGAIVAVFAAPAPALPEAAEAVPVPGAREAVAA
ncbi:MAG: hypothetical protein JWO68_1147 [Actinomycetia bacterium]|nr:hypothetical protein [Actinomycetes bacterium]